MTTIIIAHKVFPQLFKPVLGRQMVHNIYCLNYVVTSYDFKTVGIAFLGSIFFKKLPCFGTFDRTFAADVTYKASVRNSIQLGAKTSG